MIDPSNIKNCRDADPITLEKIASYFGIHNLSSEQIKVAENNKEFFQYLAKAHREFDLMFIVRHIYLALYPNSESMGIAEPTTRTICFICENIISAKKRDRLFNKVESLIGKHAPELLEQ